MSYDRSERRGQDLERASGQQAAAGETGSPAKREADDAALLLRDARREEGARSAGGEGGAHPLGLDGEAASRGVAPGPFVVYGIFDPRDGELVYVGYTDNAARRFSQHRSFIRGDSEKSQWTREVREAGFMPDCRVLSSHATADEAIEAEVALIRSRRPWLNSDTARHPGSKPLSPDRKSVLVVICMLPAEKQAIHKLAEENRLTASSFLAEHIRKTLLAPVRS
jgi:predicted GIY-YIG superfamily endonuclease